MRRGGGGGLSYPITRLWYLTTGGVISYHPGVIRQLYCCNPDTNSKPDQPMNGTHLLCLAPSSARFHSSSSSSNSSGVKQVAELY